MENETATHESDAAGHLTESVQCHERNARFGAQDLREKCCDGLPEVVCHQRINVYRTKRQRDQIDEADCPSGQ